MVYKKYLKVPALRTTQGGGIELYSFFIPGFEILRIAQISRINRNNESCLEGFQRKEIKSHVKRIVEYLESEHVLFPNSIILSMSSEVAFKKSRGRQHRGVIKGAETGILEIPIFETGEPIAWIVDGQQRSIALSQSNSGGLLVPVVAFLTDDVEIQREQFILVNKAKPLSNRLINELLPEVPIISIPRDLAPRRIPSKICSILNNDPNSPFYNLIMRVSGPDENTGVITDTAIINMIRKSINSPLGSLSPFKNSNSGRPDIDKMYRLLVIYWSSVKKVFFHAWGLPSTKSRLMHSAGIEAMGVLMDRLYSRCINNINLENCIIDALYKIKPYCFWTDGYWETMNMSWNDVQNTGKHIKMLADTLVQLDYRLQDSL
jgi:DGQHR domain-containing protein